MTAPTPDGDRPHSPAASPWSEVWVFDFWSPPDRIGGWFALAVVPAHGSAWYAACCAGPDRGPLLVVDPHVLMPEPTPSLELRAEGLWAQHVCETPLEHWTVGLEAFGVELDDPDDGLGDAWGVRTPVGADLEWESEHTNASWETGFAQTCLVTGELLWGPEALDITGIGSRQRAWGPDPVDDLMARIDDGLVGSPLVDTAAAVTHPVTPHRIRRSYLEGPSPGWSLRPG